MHVKSAYLTDLQCPVGGILLAACQQPLAKTLQGSTDIQKNRAYLSCIFEPDAQSHVNRETEETTPGVETESNRKARLNLPRQRH